MATLMADDVDQRQGKLTIATHPGVRLALGDQEITLDLGDPNHAVLHAVLRPWFAVGKPRVASTAPEPAEPVTVTVDANTDRLLQPVSKVAGVTAQYGADAAPPGPYAMLNANRQWVKFPDIRRYSTERRLPIPTGAVNLKHPTIAGYIAARESGEFTPDPKRFPPHYEQRK